MGLPEEQLLLFVKQTSPVVELLRAISKFIIKKKRKFDVVCLAPSIKREIRQFYFEVVH